MGLIILMSRMAVFDRFFKALYELSVYVVIPGILFYFVVYVAILNITI